jgi:hypothetical protein
VDEFGAFRMFSKTHMPVRKQFVFMTQNMFAQQLAQLGRGVVAQLGFLRGELWGKTLGKGPPFSSKLRAKGQRMPLRIDGRS